METHLLAKKYRKPWLRYYCMASEVEKVLLVEVKGEGVRKIQTMHNAFYNLLGQIVSRMDKEGNHPKKARIYGIAIPAIWENVFRNKIKKMTFGWKLLKLKVFLVSEKKVEERNYIYFRN